MSKRSSVSIKIPNSSGQDDIELMDIFCLPDNNSSATNIYSKHNTIKPSHAANLYLPTDIYAPKWDNKKSILKIIANAASEQAKTWLISGRTKTQLNRYGERTWTIMCEYGRTYYAQNESSKNRQNLLQQQPISATGMPLPMYDDSVRTDRMVNKDKSNRDLGRSLSRRTVTSKPLRDNLCSFQFTLYLKENEYWRIPHLPKSVGTHNHILLNKADKQSATTRMTTDQEHLAQSVMKHGHSGTAVGVMGDLTGNRYSRDQLRHFMNSDTNDRSLSSATNLMNYLRQEYQAGNKSYIALYHTVTKSSLLSIRRSRAIRELEKKKSKKKKLDDLGENDYSTPHMERHQPLLEDDIILPIQPITLHVCTPAADSNESVVTHELNTDESQLAFVETLTSLSQKLTEGTKVLLGVAWCRNDERKLFEQFPEVLMLDVTFGTNAETRPLGLTASIDGNMNLFTPVRVFMPSQCQWVFDWIFMTAIPGLLDKASLRILQMFLSDGDDKIYLAFEKAKSVYMPFAVHQLCVYHLVTQGIENMCRKQLTGLSQSIVQDQLATFKHTILSFMTADGGVETEEEYSIVIKELYTWLSKWADSDNVYISRNSKEMEIFFKTKIEIHKCRWFFPGRKHLMTLGQKTTSPLENLNAIMKVRSSKKVLPNMTLLQSLQVQDQQVEQRMSRYNIRIMKAYTSKPLWANSSTADLVCRQCESILQQNIAQHAHYICKVVSICEIMVARNPASRPFCVDCDEIKTCPLCSLSSPIIRFKRRRRITFQPLQDSSRFIVECTCPFYATYGIPCRHVCQLLAIKKTHVHVRWHNDYIALYNRDGYEQNRPYFKQLMMNKRVLVVTEEEKASMFEHAYTSMNMNLPLTKSDAFMFPFVVVQRSRNGIIPSKLFNDDDDGSDINLLEDDGIMVGAGLTQESMVQDDEGEQSLFCLQKPMFPTGNRFVNMKAELEHVYNLLENNTPVLNEFEKDVRKVISMYESKLNADNFNRVPTAGEFFSSHPEVDKRQKATRKKRSAEANRKKVTASKKKQTAQICEQSFVREV